MTRWAVALLLYAGLAMAALANDELDAAFPKDVVIVEASQFACHRFDVYLALNNRQRARGLMFVRDLPEMTGMLFVYEQDGYVSMWMKNTFIPLDMVFARRDGSVSSVARHTEPQSLRSVAAIEPVAFVLELNAGLTEKLYIDDGSRLVWEPADGLVE